MKKHIASLLVILITFITIMVLLRYKVDSTINASGAPVKSSPVKIDKSNEPGFIFDDFNRGINIKSVKENR